MHLVDWVSWLWTTVDRFMSITFMLFEFRISFWNLFFFGTVGAMIMDVLYASFGRSDRA
jgi:hypothetical protein